AHLVVNRWLELDSEIIVPFEERRAGLACFVLAAEFQLHLESDVETAERRYRRELVERTRRLPDLRHYMISKYQLTKKLDVIGATSASRPIPNPLRMAMLVFDSFAKCRDAYESQVGQELRREEEATIT